ncbi:stage III sporulation protein AF [Orenia marismortui]|uniref:Stage III sporulation protein AF n=1 Tax=Orenia marismortui TaxID=46469 RepID=A0A4R8GKE7_9FIRM|nr:stage III sporulation protein AF [Orenia marismortui]TDX43554.1 stage III sporulation protein AF [Orenia marismortui]
MNLLINWVRNIVLVILFANFIEMLLPNNKTKKDVDMIIGLFVILVILNPIINLFRFQESSLSLFNIFSYSKPPFEEIVAQGEVLREENKKVQEDYKLRISNQIAVLIKLNSDLENINIKIDLADGKLKKVIIKAKDNRVEKVTVDLSQENSSDKTDELTKNLKELISSFYGLDRNQVLVNLN